MANPGQTVCDMLQPDVVYENGRKLLVQMEGLNRAWLGGLQEVTESQWDLAARLSRCADPFEASRTCADWLEGQSELIATQGRRITDQVFKLYQPPTDQPTAATTPTRESRPTASSASPPAAEQKPAGEAKTGQSKPAARPVAATG
jgi:hypothetical protein